MEPGAAHEAELTDHEARGDDTTIAVDVPTTVTPWPRAFDAFVGVGFMLSGLVLVALERLC